MEILKSTQKHAHASMQSYYQCFKSFNFSPLIKESTILYGSTLTIHRPCHSLYLVGSFLRIHLYIYIYISPTSTTTTSLLPKGGIANLFIVLKMMKTKPHQQQSRQERSMIHMFLINKRTCLFLQALCLLRSLNLRNQLASFA